LGHGKTPQSQILVLGVFCEKGQGLMATCLPISGRMVGRLFSQLTTEGCHILGHFDFGGFHCCVRATQSDE
jgi:hypothetical protein